MNQPSVPYPIPAHLQHAASLCERARNADLTVWGVGCQQLEAEAKRLASAREVLDRKEKEINDAFQTDLSQLLADAGHEVEVPEGSLITLRRGEGGDIEVAILAAPSETDMDRMKKADKKRKRKKTKSA